ncbi:hypothetical protein NDU88_008759 [Pleurodeles waltl]|uniref:DUF4939 domain-containing protein n=1 Tax=Pleurodeles waltl TaxID=8319 RepID=A0AAV7PSI5_PLEWA|nr:hypothetical protein NDU88_008759 [Pleurodeles waltl]
MEDPQGEASEKAQAMLQTVQQQAQELQQLRAENTALRLVLSSRSMDIQPVSATIPRYSGDPLKMKEFLDALAVFFAFLPLQFSSDKAKVDYLISALSGPALAWSTPLVSADDPVLANYSTFLAVFKQMFERPGVEAAAEEALCDIHQGNQDVLKYITRFKQLAAETSWVECTFVTLFRQGLREEIKDELVNSLPACSLKDLMDQSMNIEYRLRVRKMERRRTRAPYQSDTFRASSRRTEDSPSEASPPPHEEPMQIDLVCGPLTESEREERR